MFDHLHSKNVNDLVDGSLSSAKTRKANFFYYHNE